MQPSPDNNQASDSQPKSRLDREIEEILAKSSDGPPLPPPTPLRRPQPSLPSGVTIPPRVMAALHVPIIQALLLAFTAWLIDGLSPLVASVLALAAVVCIVLPMLRGVRHSGPAIAPTTRMWRGQVIDTTSSQPRTPIESLRAWWDNRHR